MTLETPLSSALASRLLAAARHSSSEAPLSAALGRSLRRVAVLPSRVALGHERPSWPRRRRLIVGEVVRLAPGGPSYTVVRVTQVSAWLRGGHAKEVVVPDGKGGSRTFVARGSKVTTVSAFAFVERGQ